MCFISLFQIRKNPQSNEEGGKKKHLRKKIIEPIFEKISEGGQNKNNIGQISWKVNEGDKIKIDLL